MVSKYFEAGYPNTSGFRKVVKATIMVKKKDGMSDDDFVQVTRSQLHEQANPGITRSSTTTITMHSARFPYCCATG